MPDFGNFDHRLQFQPRTPLEQEKEPARPLATAYVIRHGETGEDKTNPNRGLTPRGIEQVTQAAERLSIELDPEEDILNILDSGNPRALATVTLIKDELKKRGFRFLEKIKLDRGTLQPKEGELATKEDTTSRVLGSVKKANLGSFDKQIADAELHKSLNIPEEIGDKRVAAWFLADLPEDAESPQDVNQRVTEAMNRAQKQLPLISKLAKDNQRIVTIIAVNASVVDPVVSDRTGLSPVDRKSDVANAEGFKVDFRLDAEPEFHVWGEEIERQVEGKE